LPSVYSTIFAWSQQTSPTTQCIWMECAVCLMEFAGGDELHMLPLCAHASTPTASPWRPRQLLEEALVVPRFLLPLVLLCQVVPFRGVGGGARSGFCRYPVHQVPPLTSSRSRQKARHANHMRERVINLSMNRTARAAPGPPRALRLRLPLPSPGQLRGRHVCLEGPTVCVLLK
jgi:hypothetical protein